MRKLILLLLLLSVVTVYGQNGSIGGKITDKKTESGLPGVNVILKGTYYGAATDVDGNFLIRNVAPGSYTVEISFIGYKTVQFTGTKVTANNKTTIDVKLEETSLTLTQDVVIIGEKPLVDVEETQSKKTVSSEDIELAVVENVTDVIAQQAGVVSSDNSLHIRGGRSYENAFLLDGVSVQDPLAGTGFGLQLSANSL
ncbi:MAG: PEGA domain-containing protein, partial [Chlorobiota bacterium]